MENSAKKVLYVCSEMVPYTPENDIANVCRFLPQGTQELKSEIRSFMPRYGCINERKHQLHEVIRLSGMNLVISNVDRPLIIKVASIAAAHTQVYFIDNEDYFKRNGIFADAEGKFYKDNDERAIFFARGVLETVKKLRWAPDIIHCHGWMSHLVPLFLKRVYKDDPIFSNSKVVVSLYDDMPTEPFSPDFAGKIVSGAVSEKDVDLLKACADGMNLAKTAARFANGAIVCSDKVPLQLTNYCRDRGLQMLKTKARSLEDASLYVGEYNDFYNKL